MSRVGKLPIKLPAGVEININDNHVTVKGKLGSLEYDLLPGISVETADGYLKVKRAAETKQMKANHGLSRALLQNMVTGVSEGYEKNSACHRNRLFGRKNRTLVKADFRLFARYNGAGSERTDS